MCVVSMVMDHYWEKWTYPSITPGIGTTTTWVNPSPMPTQAEIAEFRMLLERAREYDKRNHEPDCEMQEKKDRLLKLADELGLKIDFL